MKFSILAVVSTVIAGAAAHGVVTSPAPRLPGSASLAACGNASQAVLTKDLTAPIEEVVAAADAGYHAEACHAFLCRGLQLQDNLNVTHFFKPGSTVPFTVDIKVRHTGPANVSIVDLREQKAIGPALFSWPVYANASIAAADAPLNETQFSVEIPRNLEGRCLFPGECAIQWWWVGNPTTSPQTYESCVDFTTIKF